MKHTIEIKQAFTGLMDTVFTNVHEGDIISVKKQKGVIEWSDEYCGFAIKYWNKGNVRYKSMKWLIAQNFIVIGNKYDNPELL